jgi:hypothetical protein
LTRKHIPFGGSGSEFIPEAIHDPHVPPDSLPFRVWWYHGRQGDGLAVVASMS